MKAVGFDQKLKLSYLDVTTNVLRHYTEKKDMYNQLDMELLGHVKGDKSRKNTITMLMKTWHLVDHSIQDIQKELLVEYPYLNTMEKKFVHYCLVNIAYPYFREQMLYIGKYLKMSDEVHSRAIVAQMKNIFGDRRRVEVASGAVFSTAKDWDILKMKRAGIYERIPLELSLHSSLLLSLFMEVLMAQYETDTISLEVMNNNAIFFPFDYHIRIGDLNTERFTVIKTIRDTIIERKSKIPCSIE